MDSSREFTRQVLARLERNSVPPKPAFEISPKPPCLSGAPGQRACVLVVADRSAPHAVPVVRETVSLNRFGYQAGVIVDTALAAKIRRYVPARNIRVTDGPLTDESLASVRAMVVASSHSALSKVAIGIGDGLSAQAALLAIWHGIDVYMDLSFVDDDDLNGCPCQNQTLRALYNSNKEKLIALGIKHAARGEILNALLSLFRQRKELEIQPRREEPAVARVEAKRVFITVKDVLAYTGGAQWVLPDNAVVTAAAKDAAAQKKIVFCKENDFAADRSER